MFKNNEAFHFMASYAHVCLDFKDQTWLKYVVWSLCSSCKTLLKSSNTKLMPVKLAKKLRSVTPFA